MNSESTQTPELKPARTVNAWEHSKLATERKSRLFAALAKARLTVGAVEKDGETTGGQRFTYASAQAMLEVAGPALAAQGLSFFPVTTMVDEEKLMLHRQYLLTHEAGEEIAIASQTPIVIVKFSSGSQTARDKAVGAAKTVDLRYALRDLLNIPQVDENEEIERRNDDYGYADRDSRPVAARQNQNNESRRPENAAPSQTTSSKSSTDIEERKADLKRRIANGRKELGDELCKQIGLDAEPKNISEAEALAIKIDAAVRTKQSKAKPAEEKKGDWSLEG